MLFTCDSLISSSDITSYVEYFMLFPASNLSKKSATLEKERNRKTVIFKANNSESVSEKARNRKPSAPTAPALKTAAKRSLIFVISRGWVLSAM